MKVFIKTYGCTANLSDSEEIRKAVLAAGEAVVSDPEEADVVVLNTCAVTEQTSRSMLKAARQYTGRRVIVAGCMAAAQPYMLAGMEHVDEAGPGPVVRMLGLQRAGGEPYIKGRTAVISISGGCRGNCSYCIVRLVRGKLQSVPPREILGSFKKALSLGAKEIFITAQDTGAYGMDIGTRLPAMIRSLTAIEGDYRIRLGMMNPFSIEDILPDMAGVFNDPHVYRFAHIPIQSGSDRILRLMSRPYTAEEYARIADTLRAAVPGITLSTDYIVGFPTETEDDFRMTLEELRRDRPLKVNITRFSPRPGTPAAVMPDLAFQVKKARSRALTGLHHDITAEYMRDAVGKRLQVLVTEAGKPGTVVARDDSYHMVVIPQKLAPGTRLGVEVCGASTTYMIAKPVDN